MILRLSLDLPGDQEYVRTTRLLSRTLLEDLKVLPEDTQAIEVIVGALCSDIVRHANKNNPKNSPYPASSASGVPPTGEHPGYQVVLEYHKEKILVTVEDKSPGFDEKEIDAVTNPENLKKSEGGNKGNDVTVAERLGAFGISLVASLSDALNFETTDPSGTKVRAEKKLRYQSAAAEKRAEKMDESNHGQGATIQASTE